MPSCSSRFLAGVGLALAAVLTTGCGGPPALEETELALELHLRAFEARSAGDFDAAGGMLEEACLLRYEPSCQAVWLQLDLGSEGADLDTRDRLEGTARRLADASGGTWFEHPGSEGYLVRVYCPVEREADLRGALHRLRVPLGG